MIALRMAGKAIVGVVLAGGGLTQAPTAWGDLFLPTGVAPAISAAGRLVVCRDGANLNVFSAATGRWHSRLISFGTSPVLNRDLLLVPESDRWTAFSAYRGVFVDLMIDYSTSTMYSSESVAAVVRGSDLHVFSAFTGQWVTRTLPAAWTLNGTMVGPRVVLIADTNTASPSTGAAAFDAFTGSWYDLGPQPNHLQPGFVVSGATVLLDFASYQASFCGQRPGWVVDNAPPRFGSTVNSRSADLVVASGKFRSAASSTFLASPLPPASTARYEAYSQVARVADNGQEYVSGASLQPWIALPPGASFSNNETRAVALYWLPGQVIAYSGLTGSVAVTAYTGPTFTWEHHGWFGLVNDTLTGRMALFSAETGQWQALPIDVLGSLWFSRTAGLLLTTTGVTAYSPRGGRFYPLAGNGLVAGGGNNVVVAYDAGALHAFDPHRERWLSSPLAMPPGFRPLFGSGTVVATDAVRAVAFGGRSGRLEALPLPEPASRADAVDDVGWVQTAHHVFAFTSLPDVIPWSSFPETDAACSVGTSHRHQVRLPSGTVALVGIGARATSPTALPPYGEVWVDLGTASLYLVAAAPGEERGLQDLPIPDVPSLRNTEWCLQAAILPAAGQPWLGEPAIVRVQ